MKHRAHLSTSWKNIEGEEVYLHSFLTVALGENNAEFHASVALLPGKKTRYPLYRKLGGAQVFSRRFWKTETSTSPKQNSNPEPSSS